MFTPVLRYAGAMNFIQRLFLPTAIALLAALTAFGPTASPAVAQDAQQPVVKGSPYYTVKPIYIPYPRQGKTWKITNLGPVGIGIDLIDPNFTMRINRVDKGSPAAGKLKKGQIIESINGRVLKDIDPRVVLADILGQAESTDGLMRFEIEGAGEVTVELPVLGAYSETWPVGCPKSEKIVRNLARVLHQQESPGWGSVLFLLSTGEEQDLAKVRQWMQDIGGNMSYPWYIGMRGMGIAEYYLRTGDKAVLPVMDQMVEKLHEQFYEGGWSGRGKARFSYMAGGHLNAASVPCATFLMLAKQCGVAIPEGMFNDTLEHFYRYSGRGNVAYGDQEPEGGYRDNGKTAALALMMSAAAQLTPEGEDSVYAAARDNSAMKSFYATSWFNRAHTGGGIGEMWHAVAMQYMREKKPVQWRSFMDERRWHFELSRRYDGSIGIEDGARYDKTATDHHRSWGTIHALVYTAHRKNLRLFGAPPREWSQTHQLPERPWGTPADDVFNSLEPALYQGEPALDVSGEVIPTHASAPLGSMLGQPDTSDETLMRYAHHPEIGLRVATARNIARQGRNHLIMPLLNSDDPRVRDVGLTCLAGMFKGRPIPTGDITDEMWQRVGEIFENPDASWWVSMKAMDVLARGDARRAVPHVDRLMYFLQQEDWWLHTAAMQALTPLAAHERYAQRILPAVGDVITTSMHYQSSQPVRDIVKLVKRADRDVQQLGLKVFGKAYESLPQTIVGPGGQVTPAQTEILRDRAYSFLKAVPGSAEAILKMPKLTAKWQETGKESDKLIYRGGAIPNRAILGKWKVVDRVDKPEDFTGEAKKNLKNLPFKGIEFKRGGTTDNASRLWTGDMLINLATQEALQMDVEFLRLPKQRPAPYLFIEAGGFSSTHPDDWTTKLLVLEKME